MKTSIGRIDKASATVLVIFEYDGITHSRTVNAVLDPQGNHDRKATAARVEEVARGVARKIELGKIT